MSRVALTGANGFLGSWLTETLIRAGFEVRALARDGANGGVRWSLSDDDMSAAVAGARHVVHCAWSMDRAAADTNMRGTLRLAEAAARGGVERFFFISSMAAHANAESSYGRTKLEAEISLARIAAESRMGVELIRPGVVVGPGGMFARVQALARGLPILPVFYSRNLLQTVWIQDVCDAITERLRANATVSAPQVFAHEGGVPVRAFYAGVAEAAAVAARRPWLVPLPGGLALFAVHFAEALGFRLPITSDNLLGLKNVRYARPTERPGGARWLSFGESVAKMREWLRVHAPEPGP